jgi:protein-S-isoprenylcysteine O-methyltransferase Ste14
MFFLFHFLEFFITALYQPANLSYDCLSLHPSLHSRSPAYLLNHSKTYTFAFSLSLVEFWIEAMFFAKWSRRFICLGLILVGGGQVRSSPSSVNLIQFFRTLAMSTCGDNFSHLIMSSRNRHDGAKHQLITHGVYRLSSALSLLESLTSLQHPSPPLLLWLVLLVIGDSNLALQPDLVPVVYLRILEIFLRQVPGDTKNDSWLISRRVPYEEEILLQCYGEEYRAYLGKTLIGIPFVRGVELKEAPIVAPTKRSTLPDRTEIMKED